MTSEENKHSEYFNEAASWDKDKRLSEKNEIKFWKIAGVSGIVFAGLMGCSVMFLLPLKTFVPQVIRVDNATGSYDVKVAGEGLSVGESRNEKIIISDVTRYVKSRESFTRAEAEESYRTIYLMSCGIVRAEWDNYFKPELNPKSPVAVLSNQDADRVTVQSVTFLQSLDELTKVAQVQFEKTIFRGTSSPLKYRYVSTMTLRYDEKNIPSNQQNFYLNPFGFCVTDYRRDQVGNPSVGVGAGSPKQDYNTVMEQARTEAETLMQALKTRQQANQAVNLSNVGLPGQSASSPADSASSPQSAASVPAITASTAGR